MAYGNDKDKKKKGGKKKMTPAGSAKVMQKRYDNQVKRMSQGGQFKIKAEDEERIFSGMGKPAGVTRTQELDYSTYKKRKKK